MTSLSDMLLHPWTAAAAKVVVEPDPKCEGRTCVRITGPTRESVQQAIMRLREPVEAGTGHATFFGPTRLPEGGFGALGEIVITI